MTYCLGWKTKSGIIIAADTALTSDSETATNVGARQTSFGEPYSVVGGKIVEERGLKIFRFETCMLTYAGKTAIAHSIANAFGRGLSQGTAPREALMQALAVSISSADYKNISLICAFLEDKKHVLLSFSAAGDGQLIDHAAENDLIQLGSAPAAIKQLTAGFLAHIVDENLDLAAKTAKVLGVLQTYGRHGPLLSRGVGGSFSAAYIDSSGPHWQPDILYVVHKNKIDDELIVSTCVRDDCFLISSMTIDGANKCLANVPPDELRADKTRRRCDHACQEGRLQHDRGKFDYVVILNGDFPVVVVIAMKRKLKHELLWIEPLVGAISNGLLFRLHPDLVAMRDHAATNDSGQPIPTVYYRAYEKPTDDSPIARRARTDEPSDWENTSNGRGGRTKY